MNTASLPALLVVVGATGTGKSEFALDVADEIVNLGGHAEIINADAMQLYRGMDIGTAKVPVSERRGHPHRLIDILDPSEPNSVASYQTLARDAISDTIDRGSTAILVGGSGLYVSSVVFGFEFTGHSPAIRAQLEREFADTGLDALVKRLQQLDPEAAAEIDTGNPRRVIRALESVLAHGTSVPGSVPDHLWHSEGPNDVASGTDSRVSTQSKTESGSAAPHTSAHGAEGDAHVSSRLRSHLMIHLHRERSSLARALNRRATQMWADGLVDEVRALDAVGFRTSPTARYAIGYAQALAQIDGTTTEADAIAATQVATRRYARRQLSWFNRYSGAQVVSVSNSEARRAAVRGAAEHGMSLAPTTPIAAP